MARNSSKGFFTCTLTNDDGVVTHLSIHPTLKDAEAKLQELAQQDPNDHEDDGWYGPQGIVTGPHPFGTDVMDPDTMG